MNNATTSENFRKRCYAAYQLDWMLASGLSLESVFDGFKELAEELPEEALQGSVSAILDNLRKAFLERGLGSDTMYVCYDEFITHEFEDINYMDHLLSAMNASEEDIELYHSLVEPNPEEGDGNSGKGDCPCDYPDAGGMHHCPYEDTYTGYSSEMCRNMCGLGVDD